MGRLHVHVHCISYYQEKKQRKCKNVHVHVVHVYVYIVTVLFSLPLSLHLPSSSPSPSLSLYTLQGLKARGNVESWLTNVEESMVISLRKLTKAAIGDFDARPRHEWATKHASQVS